MGGFLNIEFSYGRSGSEAFCAEQCWPVGHTDGVSGDSLS